MQRILEAGKYVEITLSLFVDESHQDPLDLEPIVETRIAHQGLAHLSVKLGFIRHKSNLTGHERLAPQSKTNFCP